MRISFNDGWSYRAPASPFAVLEAGQAAPVSVVLPHDALRDTERTPDAPSRGASAYYPPGNFTYLKSFDVPPDWSGKVVSLEIQGAYAHPMVFCNEEYAGNRANGYTRFVVELTPYLRVGERNELRVEVRSGQDSRWYSGAGLHRPVMLHVTEPVHVGPDGIRVTTLDVDPDQAVVEVATRVTNRGLTTAHVTLGTTVLDPDTRPVDADEVPVTVPPGETCLVRRRCYLPDPVLWSVDRPALYSVRTSIGSSGDDRETTFGVRTVRVDPRHGLRINGEPVLLRGACIHHDNGPLGAAAVGRAEERRIELLKAAGFNAIRAAHNPVSVAMLDACDRLGMLVMDEAFDMWVRGKTPYDYALDFPQWYESDLAAMVAKDYNHPSVVMYSLGNEIAEVGTPHGAVLARRMAEVVRAEDPTRPVTNGVNSALVVLDELADRLREQPAGLNEMIDDAMNTLSTGENVTRRTAESHSVLDVVGLNYAEARYAMDRELFPHRVIVGSETFPSRIGRLWPMVEQHSHVIGDFTWTGWDYLGEVGIGATTYAEDTTAVAALEREFPFLTAWCGDLDITGHRRPVSYYREIVYGLRHEPYLAVRRPEHHGHSVTLQSPWAWSDSVSSWTWPGYEGQPVTVEVYADADEVALFLDGTEVGRSPVGDWRPKVAVVETTFRPGTLVAVAYADGTEVGHTSLSTATGPVRLTAAADRTELRYDGTDLAYVSLALTDHEGRLVSGQDRPVTVEVSGAGTLAGMCSANPRTAERFADHTWRTFDGRALAVVRPTAEGPITVTATTEGCAPVEVALHA
ncbi:glycoside hydrolase family 2 TIM barrel-domain containing protein [Actinopolymorpha rutila]|uniref:Glycosyl hydrolases family 2 n=1 Tax=Actinopolymorpha rutila TaxID=446787 RepID=A0A852ZXB7_9ACTN|nr:glycoside hydrolase family 2 TIM barrel-domain containing protein [Actinopolymorpha rutila]NYH93366.1 hypothetical protein [Actinopolymorpha rutila]